MEGVTQGSGPSEPVPGSSGAPSSPPQPTGPERKAPSIGKKKAKAEASGSQPSGHEGEWTTAVATDNLLESFKAMTLLELSEFVKAFETTFDVSASRKMPTERPQGPNERMEHADAEQDEFDVILTAAGDQKIRVIKEVRVLTTLGLKEAKDLVDSVPEALMSKVDKDTADRARAALEAAGATVEIR